MDNIDVDYARGKGIAVHNTPAASSESVAELCMAHAYGLVALSCIRPTETCRAWMLLDSKP